MRLSGSQQRNAVSEGIALGLLMCGRREFPESKLALDLSFEDAWRAWDRRGDFGQVSTDLRNGTDAVYVMTHASERKHTLDVYWIGEVDPYSIGLRRPDDEFDPDDIAAHIDGDVPAAVWHRLAEIFISHLDSA